MVTGSSLCLRAAKALVLCWLLWLSSAAAQAQQPFFTDDADVTPRGRFQLEFVNQYDLLQHSAFPNLRQNTATFTFSYGLLEGLEVGVATSLVAIFNDRRTSPRAVFGAGDTRLAFKYNFRREREGSRLPALAVSGSVGIPTGNARRQLGTGLVDFALSGIVQKSLRARTTLRANAGALLIGSNQPGAFGSPARGAVFAGGVSVVREMMPRLYLGAEVTGAHARDFAVGYRQMQLQLGGNYLLRDNLSLDFGIIGGRFAASPRLGGQLGFSFQF